MKNGASVNVTAFIGGLINIWGGSCNKRRAEEKINPNNTLALSLLPVVKCQASPHLEEEEDSCQSF